MAKKSTKRKSAASSGPSQFTLKVFKGNVGLRDELKNASESAAVGFIVAAPATPDKSIGVDVTCARGRKDDLLDRERSWSIGLGVKF